jgi:hypothetical protein
LEEAVPQPGERADRILGAGELMVRLGYRTVNNPSPDALADQATADALAQTLQRALEPGRGPDRASLSAAMAEVSALFDENNASYQKWIYADPNQERA